MVSLYDNILSSDEDENARPVRAAPKTSENQPENSGASQESTSDSDVRMLPAPKRQALMARPALQHRSSRREEVSTVSERMYQLHAGEK